MSKIGNILKRAELPNNLYLLMYDTLTMGSLGFNYAIALADKSDDTFRIIQSQDFCEGEYQFGCKAFYEGVKLFSGTIIEDNE